jgi:hypothetical protein
MTTPTKAIGVALTQQPPAKNILEKREPSFTNNITQKAFLKQEAKSDCVGTLAKTKFTRHRDRKKTYKGKGYCTKYCFVTSSVKEGFDTLLASYNKDTKSFFIHLYASSLLNYEKKDGWIELHSLFIKDEFHKMSAEDLDKLISDGLVEVNLGYAVGSKCKSYRINQEGFAIICDRTYEDLLAGDNTRFDLVTGKQLNSSPKSLLISLKGVQASELQKAAIESYRNSPNKFHRPSVLNELAIKKQAYENELATNGRTTLFYSLRCRFWNSLHCFKSVMIDYKAVGIGNGFYLYTPAYEPQISGRITHIKGGFQSCSRAVTAAAFAQSGYTNYDLAASQPTIYNEMLKGYKIDDGGWLQDYIDGVTTKQSIAKEIGIEVDTWKKIICGLLMGSTVPKMTLESFVKAKDIKGDSVSSIIKYLQEGQTPELAYNSYCKFLEVCKPLLAAVKEVGDRIKLAVKNKSTKLLPELTKNKGKWAVINKTGNLLYVDSLKPSDLVAKVAAHLLQGAERALVSNILLLASKYNFRPVADYHDGFLSDGLVPQACVDEAIAACGVFGKLEIKPLVVETRKEVSEEIKQSIERLVYSSKFLEIAAVCMSSNNSKTKPVDQTTFKLHPT